MLTQLREYFGKMSRRNRIILAILTVVVIVLAIVIVSLISRTNYVLLINAYDQAEAGRIYSTLRDMNVPAKIEGSTAIMVPEDRVSELGALLSAEGVLGPTGIDLTIMSNANSFSVTDAHATKLYEYQRADDIRTFILQSPKIENCVVLVNLGETSAFARPQNTKQPMASVMLSITGGATLTNQEAQSIADTVRTSVPGISYENITIADTTLRQYRVSDDGTIDPDSEFNSRVALQTLISGQYQEQGLQILTPVFGLSNVEVTASVILDFDKETIESVEYAPPVPGELEGIVRSSSKLWEAQRTKVAAEGVPGTDSNGMGTVEYPYGTLEDGDIYEKALEERNFEINEVRRLIEKEQGKIKTINIAVMLNSMEIVDDYTDDVADIISRGMGIPIQNVAVKSIPFQNRDSSLKDAFDQWVAYEEARGARDNLRTIIMWVAVAVLGIAFFTLIGVIFKGTRPVPEPVPVLVDSGPGYIDYIASDDYVGESEPEIEDVELVKKSTGLEQIERFIDRDPGSVAQLLRNWLTED